MSHFPHYFTLNLICRGKGTQDEHQLSKQCTVLGQHITGLRLIQYVAFISIFFFINFLLKKTSCKNFTTINISKYHSNKC